MYQRGEEDEDESENEEGAAEDPDEEEEEQDIEDSHNSHMLGDSDDLPQHLDSDDEMLMALEDQIQKDGRTNDQ